MKRSFKNLSLKVLFLLLFDTWIILVSTGKKCKNLKKVVFWVKFPFQTKSRRFPLCPTFCPTFWTRMY